MRKTISFLSLVSLVALGCNDKTEDSGAPADDTAAGDTGDTATDSGDTGDAEIPPECEEPVDPPDLADDAWTAAAPAPGGDIRQLIVSPSDPDWIYSGSDASGVYLSTDGGWSWSRTASPDTQIASQIAVHPADPTRAVYATGVVQMTDDGGASWTELPLGGELYTEAAVHGLAWADDALFAVDGDGQVYRSDDFGQSFDALGVVDTRRHAAIGEFDAFYYELEYADGWLYAIQDGGDFFRSDDGGANWEVLRDGEHVFGTMEARGAELWAGEVEALYYSDDNGSTWEKLASPYQVNGLSVSTETDLVALSSSYGLWVYTDAEGLDGYYIEPAQIPSAIHLMPGDGFLLGHAEGILLSDDEASSWSDVGGLVESDLASLASDPACGNRLWAGSSRERGMYVSEDWGQTWSHNDDDVPYVGAVRTHPSDRYRLWMTADDEVFESTDLGASWDAKTPEEMRVQHRGVAIDPDDPDVVLAGTVYGGLFGDESGRVVRTDDGGVSWADSSEGLPQNEAAVQTLALLGGGVALAGTWRGGDSPDAGTGIGLYRSTDLGASWSAVDAGAEGILELRQCGDRVYAATDGGVLTSDDAGASWAVSLEGAFSSVACRGDVALAAATDGALSRSDDGGVSWSGWGDGLPTPDAEGFEHDLAIPPSGEVAYVSLSGFGLYLRPL